jgi:hypothetical protein
MKYTSGKIYMLEPITEYDEGDVYYGSTIQPLFKRFNQHKYIWSCKSRELFIKYGINNIQIILVKSFSCNNREELENEEGEFIKNNECINKSIPRRTRSEYYKQTKKKKKEHAEREINDDEVKDKINEIIKMFKDDEGNKKEVKADELRNNLTKFLDNQQIKKIFYTLPKTNNTREIFNNVNRHILEGNGYKLSRIRRRYTDKETKKRKEEFFYNIL